CQLIDQSVCKRITEGNAQLDHVHAGAIELNGQLPGGLEVWVAGTDVHDKTFFAVAFQTSESFHNAVHVAQSVTGRMTGFKRQVKGFLYLGSSNQKAPTSKLQAPEKLQAPSTNRCVCTRFGAWRLVLLWRLEL